MTFGSLFSGIGGFDLGLERAGLSCAWQVECDAQCNQVLARHWPSVRRYEDVRTVGADLAPVDLICGGFPCQDLSVAGKRAGLAGERSGLWNEFRRILWLARPQWCLIENVPGLFTSNGGRDFAVILRGLVQLGYGVCWRVLDAQFAGLAQRRKRVFIVGSLGNGRAAEVLFEPESVRWNPAPRREARASVAGTLGGGAAGRGRRDNPDSSGAFVATGLRAADGHHGRSSPRGDGGDNLIAGALNNLGHHGWTANAQSVAGNQVVPDVAWALQERDAKGADSDTKDGVRRLTPRECERLQGFPDDWTDGHADTHRYRMLGNAVAVPVAEWIGRALARARIAADAPLLNGGHLAP